MKPKRLVLIGGNVASGKTTVAKRLSAREGFVFLDKDQVGEPLTRALMGYLSGDPMDRDSEIYSKTVRDLTYKTFMKVAKNLLKNSKTTVVATAPFTHEFWDEAWLNSLDSWGKRQNVDVIYVWVECQDELRKERILKRNARRDDVKLAEWDEWVTTLTARPSIEGLIVVDNSGTKGLKALIRDLAASLG